MLENLWILNKISKKTKMKKLRKKSKDKLKISKTVYFLSRWKKLKNKGIKRGYKKVKKKKKKKENKNKI